MALKTKKKIKIGTDEYELDANYFAIYAMLLEILRRLGK